jgi:RNA polymerase sigma factor for flagellar operon FliA
MERPDSRDRIRLLVESHLGYAHAIAAEMLKKLPASVNRADVERAAEFGLTQAANSYDPSRTNSFATFAYYRVRGAIYDDLRRASRAITFEEAANAYMIDYSSCQASAASPEAEDREVRRLTSHVVTSYLLSLDSMRQEPSSRSIESPLQRVLRKERQKQLREAVSRLPEKNRRVIAGYYFAGLSFGQIGRDLGLSESSAWRIHAKSLEMIRTILDEKTTMQAASSRVRTESAVEGTMQVFKTKSDNKVSENKV